MRGQSASKGGNIRLFLFEFRFYRQKLFVFLPHAFIFRLPLFEQDFLFLQLRLFVSEAGKQVVILRGFFVELRPQGIEGDRPFFDVCALNPDFFFGGFDFSLLVRQAGFGSFERGCAGGKLAFFVRGGGLQGGDGAFAFRKGFLRRFERGALFFEFRLYREQIVLLLR